MVPNIENGASNNGPNGNGAITQISKIKQRELYT
jgi:hypothetical protein